MLDTDYIKPFITYDSEIISEGKWALFCKPKVMVAGMTKIIEASLDSKGEYAPAVSVYSVCGELDKLYQVQLIINSKLINWFFRYKFSDKHMAGGYISVNNLLLQKIPFRQITDLSQTKILVENANKYRLELETLANNFSALLKSKFELEKISRKLQNWYQLEFKDFWNEYIICLSETDNFINLEHAEQYYCLLEDVELLEFKDKWHFNNAAKVFELPEILEYFE